MNPEPQTQDNQPSIEIDWPSDTDSSILLDLQTYDLNYDQEAVPQNNDDLPALHGLDTCDSDSTAKALQQSIENPCSETQVTAEEPQTPLIGATQPTTGIPPLIADADDSTLHPIHSTPELAVQKASEADDKEGEGQPIPEVGSIEEIETRFRFLRHKLQKGFLPEVGRPEADDMKDMSAYLRKLERMRDPPGSVLRITRIAKLLKRIKNLDEIPRDDQYSFKKRAARLLEKWATSLEKEGQTTSSTGQPIKHGGVGLNPVAEEHKHSNTADSQKPLDNGTQTPATGLVEECVLDMVIDSGQSTSDRSDESTAVPANEQTQHTPAPSPSLQDSSKSKPERVVIDLTDDDEVDMATGLGLPGQPTDDQNLRHSAAKSTQVPRSPSPSSTNSEPISTTAQKIPASPKSDSAKLDTKKRKRSDATNRERALVSASKFCKLQPNLMRSSNSQS
ncbi:hypothetical protein BKA65DRAFT_485469 [Rhexocercosporidium sp. MPI-PUGE-AT-0058]|nr:hypothetical protein BKA65DRAFT_485469 [Rhexocercosporidium sp. MPI-PUGE-AT-0058]